MSVIFYVQSFLVSQRAYKQIGLEISYSPLFNSTAPPETYKNLVYDRAGVLFNIASLQSQLAMSEDRSTPHGLKQAIKFYQVAYFLIIDFLYGLSDALVECRRNPELLVFNGHSPAPGVHGTGRCTC